MVKKILISILLIVIGVTVLIYFFYPMSDQDLVNKNFSDLSYYVNKPGREGASTMVLKSNSLSKLFNSPCGLDVPHSFLAGNYTQSQIAANAFKARHQFKNVTLKFYDIRIDVEDKTKAKAVFTARLTGVLTSDNAVDETREMEADLKKVDGKWLFTNFRLVEVLER